MTTANAKWANLALGFFKFFIVWISPFVMAKWNRRPVILTSCTFCGVFLVLATIVVALIVSDILFDRHIKLNYFFKSTSTFMFHRI